MSGPPPERRIPTWTDPVTADLGGRETDWPHADWWWLGVHGGAGVTTLAAMVPGGGDANRRWPDPAKGGPRAVVLVGRESARGLRSARAALRQYAACDVPEQLHVVGVALVSDGPGRLDRHRAAEVALVRGVAPTVWRVPWMAEVRETAEPVTLPVPPALYELYRDLSCLRSTGGTAAIGSRPGPPARSTRRHDLDRGVLPAMSTIHRWTGEDPA